MASRRKAREAVLKALYLGESRDMSVVEAFAEMATHDTAPDPLPSDDDPDDPCEEGPKPYSLDLTSEQKLYADEIGAVIEINRDVYNTTIRDVLHNWDLGRVARIDRMILWIAIAEMSTFLDIPVTVSINEAIELAKKYSSQKSPAFINGVLDSIARNKGLLTRGDARSGTQAGASSNKPQR